MKTFPFKLSVAIIFMNLLFVSATFGQNQLQDLVGARANSVDSEMYRKGFVHITSSKSYSGIYSYWWKSANSKCVSVRIEDGYVRAVRKTLPADCNQNGSYSSYQNHQSHHHDSYNHYENTSHDDSFERGFNDGLYHRSYHNTYSNTESKDAYIRGYEKGVDQRQSNTSYHQGAGGHTTSSKLGDVTGWSSQAAYQEIENRGYRFVKQYINDDGKKVKVWYSTEHRKCKKTAEKNNKITLVAESKQCGH